MANKYNKKEEVVRRLAEEGHTINEIAALAEIPEGSINYFLKKWGIKTARSRGRYDHLEDDIRFLCAEGNTDAEIAEATNIPLSTVNYLRAKNGIGPAIRKGKHDHKRDEAEKLLRQDMSITQVAEKLDIPTGSIAFVLAKWGLTDLQIRNRGITFSDKGRKAVAESARDRHANAYTSVAGDKHPLAGLLKLHGEWVPEDEVRVILKEHREQDITLAEMAESCQVDPRTITNWLQRFGLQGGLRSGDRTPMWKGGHTKYRGPGWLTIRQEILERDGYKCTECGLTQEEARAGGHGLSVHHVIPFEQTQDNSHGNLKTLCQSHHMMAEWESGTRVASLPV